MLVQNHDRPRNDIHKVDSWWLSIISELQGLKASAGTGTVGLGCGALWWFCSGLNSCQYIRSYLGLSLYEYMYIYIYIRIYTLYMYVVKQWSLPHWSGLFHIAVITRGDGLGRLVQDG